MIRVALEAPYRMAVEEAPAPEPGPGQALVRVQAVAVCGTDLHLYGGHPPVAYPRVLGHEIAGVVEAVGPGVDDLSVGQRVAVDPGLSCGLCPLCTAGRNNLCPNGGLLGREADGGLQEFLALPRPMLFPLPEGLAMEEAALVQLLSTVVHAQRQADIGPGASVVVLGQGASGLLHTALAVLSGAFPVVAVGRSPWKLELARRMGAHAVVGADDDPVAAVRRVLGTPGAQVVIETAGTLETVRQALDLAAPGATVIQYGIPPVPLESLDLYPLYFKEVRLLFPRAMTRDDFRRAVDLAARGVMPLGDLITRRHGLRDAPETFHRAAADPRSVLRILFRP